MRGVASGPALLAVAAGLLVAASAACGGSEPEEGPWVSPLPFDTAQATVVSGSDSFPLVVEVAETDEERQFGLSRRPSLDPGSGMIFLFDSLRAPEQGFWMWRTRVPLDIAFLDSAGVIRSIVSMEPCADALYAQACPTYPAGAPYLQALEVNQGWFEEQGVEAGARVILER